MEFSIKSSAKWLGFGVCAFALTLGTGAGAQAPVDTRIPATQQTPAPDGNAGGTAGGAGAMGGLFGWSSGSSGGQGQAQNQTPNQPNNQPQGTIDPITGNPTSTPTTGQPSVGGGFGGSSAPDTNLDGQVGGAGASLRAITGRVGLSYTTMPNYFGANEGRNPLALFIDATFGANGFINNEDGLGFHLLSLGSLESKMSINAAYGQIFENKTKGLDALSAYGVLETDVALRSLTSAYELELGIPLSGPDGWTLTGSAQVATPLGDLGGWDARLSLTYASTDWMQSYYGISAAQASASGLSAYSPKGGLREIDLSTNLDIPLGLSWGFDLGAGARRMLGDAADAPHVRDAGAATDFYGHMALYYRF